MLRASNMFGVILLAILLSTLTDLLHGRYVPHPELQRDIEEQKLVATWDEAKLRCEQEGAMLASPIDSGLLEYMKSSMGINNHTTPYFIGMRLINDSEHNRTTVVSLEGVLVEDLPQAALDMIEKIDPQDGGCLVMDSHKIRTGSCQDRLPYICYKNDTTFTTTTSTTEAPDECTSGGYTELSGGYYKLHSELSQWEQANATCASEGGYLVVLNDLSEAQTVSEFAFPTTDSTYEYVYIGIRDRIEDGGWHSVLGEPLRDIYNAWAYSRYFYEDACGVLKEDAYITALKCSKSFPFICEKSCTPKLS